MVYCDASCVFYTKEEPNLKRVLQLGVYMAVCGRTTIISDRHNPKTLTYNVKLERRRGLYKPGRAILKILAEYSSSLS